MCDFCVLYFYNKDFMKMWVCVCLCVCVCCTVCRCVSLCVCVCLRVRANRERSEDSPSACGWGRRFARSGETSPGRERGRA